MKLFRLIWSVISKLFSERVKPLKTVYVDDKPETLDPKSIYLVGENEYLWFVMLLCPCGCSSVIHLNLLPEVKPYWKVEKHEDGTVSLSPSVWSKRDCGSHYFIRQGLICWCSNKSLFPTLLIFTCILLLAY